MTAEYSLTDDYQKRQGQKPETEAYDQGAAEAKEQTPIQAEKLYSRADARLDQRHLRVGDVLDAW